MQEQEKFVKLGLYKKTNHEEMRRFPMYCVYDALIKTSNCWHYTSNGDQFIRSNGCSFWVFYASKEREKSKDLNVTAIFGISIRLSSINQLNQSSTLIY